MPTFIDRIVYINEILSVDVERKIRNRSKLYISKKATYMKVLTEGH